MFPVLLPAVLEVELWYLSKKIVPWHISSLLGSTSSLRNRFLHSSHFSISCLRI